jgi:hypothetical protein
MVQFLRIEIFPSFQIANWEETSQSQKEVVNHTRKHDIVRNNIILAVVRTPSDSQYSIIKLTLMFCGK